MDLRRMMLLVDLAELGSIAAVAERRNLTSSAVSRQLRLLGEELGAELYRSDGRTLGLTHSGEVLVEHARSVTRTVDTMLSAVAASRDTLDGQVVISCYNMGVALFAGPVVQRLSRSDPDLRVQVRQASSAAALRLLRQGEIDLAVTMRYDFAPRPSMTGLAAEQLLHEPLVLVAPVELHAAVREHGLGALAGQPWVTGPEDSGLGVALRRLGETVGFTPQIKYRVIGAKNVGDLAATEVVTALVPDTAVPPQLRALVLDPPAHVDLGGRVISALVRETSRRDPKLWLVLRALRAVVADQWPAPWDNAAMQPAD
ncbi:LysR family transcriptional regulator [Nocardia sp. NPDC058176]|uniref:LysR family transcriptional regulator n=1 Tax=Nocardia sp. NPDC058176 TaxID=3346368 RepID=UPI0036D8C8DA